MMETFQGRAYLFVKNIHELVLVENTNTNTNTNTNNNNNNNGLFEMVAEDGIVIDWTERILKKQKQFYEAGFPSNVDIGYHYTDNANIEVIGKVGLLSHPEERKQNNITPTGQQLGGISTAFKLYGDRGILVARLQGRSVFVATSSSLKNNNIEYVDTITGNENEVVLRTKEQCIPLIRYPTSLLSTPGGEACIEELSTRVHAVIDEFFNIPSVVQFVLTPTPLPIVRNQTTNAAA
jgi:hypothetical protein